MLEPANIKITLNKIAIIRITKITRIIRILDLTSGESR